MVHTRAQQIKLEVIKRVCRLPFKKGHKSMVSAVYQVIFTKVILTKFLPPKIARTEMRAIFAPNLPQNIPRAVRFSQIFRSFHMMFIQILHSDGPTFCTCNFVPVLLYLNFVCRTIVMWLSFESLS